MTVDVTQLPAWIRAGMDLRSNVAQWPIAKFSVLKYGAFGATRSSPQEGACGPKPGEPMWIDNPADSQQEDEAKRIKAQRWPCKHYGTDLSAPQGTKVVAPRDGWILYHGPANVAPFIGYGPWVMLIAHKDVGDSMWRRGWRWATGRLIDVLDFPEGLVSASYSLIGHLAAPHFYGDNLANAPDAGKPRIPLPGDFWESVGGNADKWKRIGPKGSTARGMMTDADAYNDGGTYPGIETEPPSPRKVFAGQYIGNVSDANHVHWEVRPSPVASPGERRDPIEYFRLNYQLGLPDGAKVPRSGGGGGILLLFAALAFGKKKKQRR